MGDLPANTIHHQRIMLGDITNGAPFAITRCLGLCLLAASCLRGEAVSLWVVPSNTITASTPDDMGPFFDPGNEKPYRHPQFYKVPRGVKM